MKGRSIVRAIAIILLLITVYVGILFSAVTIYAYSEGAYGGNANGYFDSLACSSVLQESAEEIYHEFYYAYGDTAGLKEFVDSWGADRSNIAFTVTDTQGALLAFNYEVPEYSASYSQTFNMGGSVEKAQYTVTCYAVSDFTATDAISDGAQLHSIVMKYKYVFAAGVALCFVAALSLFIFLMCGAGHRPGKEGITLSTLDRLPLELYAIFSAAVGGACVYAAAVMVDSLYIPLAAILAFVPVSLGQLVIYSFIFSFAARVKAGGWWRGTIIYIVLRFFYRIFRRLFRWAAKSFSNLHDIWKGVVVYLVFAFVSGALCGLAVYGGGTVLLLWFFVNVLMFAAWICFLNHLVLLKDALARIADGNTGYKLDTAGLHGSTKKQADDLNRIGESIETQVEERMKSERLKTELITNVSHDIKTPLTSIINYTDLLAKEDIQDEKALEYIGVIQRQSARLKKLVVDLVEASKASSGSVKTECARIDIAEALHQAVGEYAERFEAAGIEPVTGGKPEGLFAFADGRLVWRIIDNLCNNVCKYSAPGTRVYIDCGESEGKVFVSLRNISRQKLNIDAAELMERFVRGDESRATEGSGLGLSIAQSLARLQGGELALSIDGDMFKAVVTLPKASETQQ